MMKVYKLITPLAMLVTILVGTSAMASGGSPGANTFAPNNSADYDLGKAVFFKKIICETCPYGDISLDTASVENILPEVHRKGSIGKELTIKERKSVKLFIKTRFNI